MKIGFELEAFCLKRGEDLIKPVTEERVPSFSPCLVPDGLPLDECGWLVEVRSEPHTDITKAIFLLQAETRTVEAQAKLKGVSLSYVPLLEIPRDLKVKAARRHGKGLISYRNLYGHETHRTRLATASLHISFTEEKMFRYREFAGMVQGGATMRDGAFTYPGFVDHARIIVSLDKAFAKEIAAAKRNPGFYEVKADGRIEYRSLPNNVCLDKLERELRRIL